MAAPRLWSVTAAGSSQPSKPKRSTRRWASAKSRLPNARPGSPILRATSMCSAGWPTGTSPMPQRGWRCCRSMNALVADFNYQVHWAHRERQDNRQSPAEVLGWVSGVVRTPEQLHRIFYATRFGRWLDKAGYVRFRHWRLYGEQGLARQQVAVWLY